MSAVLDELAGDLKKLREDKQLSQRELAKRLGIQQSHISKIETGRVNLSVETFFQMVRALEHDVMLIPREEILTVKAILQAKRHPPSEWPDPAYTPEEEN